MRVGIGYDVHPLVAGRPLVLGGVRIPHTTGLDGHSDADVLTHAVIDALLGAAGLGDIGRMFPASDARFKDASSLEFLSAAVKAVSDAGFRVVNVDCTAQVTAGSTVRNGRIPPRAASADRLGVCGPRSRGVRPTTFRHSVRRMRGR